MSTGSGRHKTPQPQVNVTPLVDVALVVLIIFMVVTPLAMKTFWLNLPNKPDENAEVPPPKDDGSGPLVMTIAGDRTIRVDSTVLRRDEIEARLPGMLAAKDKRHRVLYFDAHADVPYGTAVEVMDLARAGGARTIAISTTEIATAKIATAKSGN